MKYVVDILNFQTRMSVSFLAQFIVAVAVGVGIRIVDKVNM